MVTSRTGTTRDQRYTTSVTDLLRRALEVIPRLDSLAAVWVGHRMDPTVRELLMVAVARANGCRYCAFTHEVWARTLGADEGTLARVEASDDPALDAHLATLVAFARAHGDVGSQGPSEDLAEWAERELSAVEQRDAETVAKVMAMANLTGNTWDALQSRMAGHPTPGSRLIDELLVSAAFWAVAPGVALLLAAMRGTSPVALLRDFQAFSRTFEPKSASGPRLHGRKSERGRGTFGALHATH